jgi:hypothetical protein
MWGVQPRTRTEIVPYNRATLHYKLDSLHFGHIRNGIASDRNDIRKLAFFDHAIIPFRSVVQLMYPNLELLIGDVPRSPLFRSRFAVGGRSL